GQRTGAARTDERARALEVRDLAADGQVLEPAARLADVREVEAKTRVVERGEARGERLVLRALLRRLHAVTEDDGRTAAEIGRIGTCPVERRHVQQARQGHASRARE